ncbi:hypothetical protein [Amycolatopsis sp. cmx-4-61]|uniref:hypothetical protein n=1 Tax=Amycolatopsis sp. cmx-4-61 TaxID=2790937 RepID=UPI00397BD00D
MAELPLRDRAGNVLLAVRRVAENELPHLGPLPASLVVVVHAGAVLLAVYRTELATAPRLRLSPLDAEIAARVTT